MSLIAPNLTELVGETVAAKLIGKAGGLQSLARMPSCNVYVIIINIRLAARTSKTGR